MFLGSFKTYFSGQNRLILPKKFRRELGQQEKFFILMGENGEIWGFDPDNWLKQARLILQIPLFSEEGRIKRLKFFSHADECILDSQGRFILPPEFVAEGQLKKEVLLLGAGDHFEIWNPQQAKLKINEYKVTPKN